MARASCLCGKLAWELDGLFELMSHCRCSRCRKAHGVGFATYVARAGEGFRLRGREHAVRWESSPGFVRCFCARCGSVVPGDAFEGRVFLPAGNFDDDPGRTMTQAISSSKKTCDGCLREATWTGSQAWLRCAPEPCRG